jgi:hypothetical protein
MISDWCEAQLATNFDVASKSSTRREGSQCGTLASKMSRPRSPFVNTSQVGGRVGATLCRTRPVLEREGLLRRLELMVADGSAAYL